MHFHITVRLIRATSWLSETPDEVWQVSDTRQPSQKRDVTLPEIVNFGQLRAARFVVSFVRSPISKSLGSRGKK